MSNDYGLIEVSKNFNTAIRIATDLKLCNFLLGLMTHRSCHPCAWCDCDNDNLHMVGNQHTTSSLMKLFWDFFESEKDKKDAKNFGNVIAPPVICNDVDDHLSDPAPRTSSTDRAGERTLFCSGGRMGGK